MTVTLFQTGQQFEIDTMYSDVRNNQKINYTHSLE
jgi:hypothetical protein